MARTGAWCKKLIGELHPYIESLDWYQIKFTQISSNWLKHNQPFHLSPTLFWCLRLFWHFAWFLSTQPQPHQWWHAASSLVLTAEYDTFFSYLMNWEKHVSYSAVHNAAASWSVPKSPTGRSADASGCDGLRRPSALSTANALVPSRYSRFTVSLQKAKVRSVVAKDRF